MCHWLDSKPQYCDITTPSVRDYMCPSMPRFTFLICKMKFILQDYCDILKMHLCVYLWLWGTHLPCMACLDIDMMNDSLCELVLSCPVGSGNWAKAVRLRCKCLLLLSHLAGPFVGIYWYKFILIIIDVNIRKQEALSSRWTKVNTTRFGTLIRAFRVQGRRIAMNLRLFWAT